MSFHQVLHCNARICGLPMFSSTYSIRCISHIRQGLQSGMPATHAVRNACAHSSLSSGWTEAMAESTRRESFFAILEHGVLRHDSAINSATLKRSAIARMRAPATKRRSYLSSHDSASSPLNLRRCSRALFPQRECLCIGRREREDC